MWLNNTIHLPYKTLQSLYFFLRFFDCYNHYNVIKKCKITSEVDFTPNLLLILQLYENTFTNRRMQ